MTSVSATIAAAPDAPALPLPAAVARLPSVDDEGRAFWRLRSRLIATIIHQTLTRTWLRVVAIVVLSLMLWGILFWLCFDGFRFLQVTLITRDIYDQVVRAVLGMFFVSLMVMLVFSSGIILYGSLFCSREAAYLLSLPARAERVFLHKFQEALLFSSWGFMLLGSPLLLAYGLSAHAPWYYYALLPAFMVAFVHIPAAIGAVICLFVVHRLTNRLFAVVAAAVIVVLASFAVVGWFLLARQTSNILTPAWLQELLGRLEITEQRLLPSWWLCSGLLETAREQFSEGLLFLVLLASNALFLMQIAVWVSGVSYRAGYSALQTVGATPRRAEPVMVDRCLTVAGSILPSHMRLLLVKDLRIFRRDPVQWSQFSIFFGLLALYFLNIRRFTYDLQYAGWMNMVSFLNLSVVGLLLSTFNTRFIFPMISMEGRRFWILGLLPVRRDTILWGKFWFAGIACAVPCALLILLSDWMLDVSGVITASHQLTCLLLSVGLSGIAVGFGAKFPHLREQSPARIASGNGGTLTLVVSTAYILVIVALTALPCHFYFAVRDNAGGILARLVDPEKFHFWFALGTVASIAFAAVATVLPLRMGFRAFRQLEF